MRYVLSDELTQLCTALAHSKGSSTLACTDLLRVPSERLWVEWCEAPWSRELSRYGFKAHVGSAITGRRGALIYASPCGRRGLLRTFWTTGDSELQVFASNMEGYFDFDLAEGEALEAADQGSEPTFKVFDEEAGRADVLRRCFRFRYEPTWWRYYQRASLSPSSSAAIAHHALSTVAVAVPMLLAFFLLLAARPALPRRPLLLERLNRARSRSGKAVLLEQIEVSAPLLPGYTPSGETSSGVHRRAPRLHHVRGHLVRRGSTVFWRIPHLRGSRRAGVIRTRTLTWTFDGAGSASPEIRQG